jgi:hypothetical protein
VLQIELSFFKLLRFSCGAILCIFFIYWMKKHIAYKLIGCKNDQAGSMGWQVIAWPGQNCLAQRLRDFIVDTNAGLVIPEYVFAKSKKFVFRAIRRNKNKTTGHNHCEKLKKLGVSDTLTGDGYMPISCEKSKKSYRSLVRLMRLAMRRFNKYTPKQCKVFSSQSLRRGGDTKLWKHGAAKRFTWPWAAGAHQRSRSSTWRRKSRRSWRLTPSSGRNAQKDAETPGHAVAETGYRIHV